MNRLIIQLSALMLAATAICPACAGPAAAGNNQSEIEATIGFDGKFKLGNWVPVFVQVSSDIQPVAFKAAAPDGNGIPVTFEGPLVEDRPGQYQFIIKVGRRSGTISVVLFDEREQVVGSTAIDFADTGEVASIESTVPMILTIESEDKLASTLKSLERQFFDSTCQVIPINNAGQLARSWLAYQGIRIIYLTTSNIGLVQSISEEQLAAIETWVRNGGKLVFCAGKNSDSLFNDPGGLRRFLPGTYERVHMSPSSSVIERYANSKLPLLSTVEPAVPITVLADVRGIVEPGNARYPLIVRQPYGFGQIIFSTVDFDAPPISEWNGQKNLLLKATFRDMNLNVKSSAETESRSVVRVGYQDLIGQLMLPLERFSRVRFVNFTVVAILISVFVVCIGPGDFFVLRKLIGRMEWTWITFPLTALAFCGLAIAISNSIKPAEIQINQLEIIDVDARSNHVRGSIWTNIYSPSNTRADISCSGMNGLGIDTSISSVCWMGIPGRGLGTMQSMTRAALYEPGYQCRLSIESPAQNRSNLSHLPVRVSSTSTLFTQYQSNAEFRIRSRLKLNKSQNRLRGTITNPLNVELHDCRLIFENWAYILPRSLQPGESIDVASEMKERTAMFYFSRRQEGESDKGGGLPWNPNDTNMDRIAEMLMFHGVVQGKQYTGMTHQFQPFIDLSEQAELQSAILIGKTGDVATRLRIDCHQGENDDESYDHCQTFVRFVLPVDFDNP